jgi:hypothetical protein
MKKKTSVAKVRRAIVESITPIKEFHILNLGAGVQSTTLYLMSLAGIGPRYDAAIFADTQEEPEEVYHHLRWLQSLDGPPIYVRSIGRLGDHLIEGRGATGYSQKATDSRGRFAAIPAFTTSDGGVTRGITRRQCTKEYKTELIDRTVRREVVNLLPRQSIPKGIEIFSYIGISLDEKSRASRIYERFIGRRRWSVRFPLLETMYTRADCRTWLERFGNVPHKVPRSACVFCPFHNDDEWIRLKTKGGQDWSRIVQIDHALRAEGSICNRDMKQVMYLHDSCRPIDEVAFVPGRKREVQLGFAVGLTPVGFESECEGVCDV